MKDGPSRLVLRVLTGEPEEMSQLSRVLAGAPDYAQRVTGLPPGPADAQSLFSILPPGLGYDAKHTFGLLLRSQEHEAAEGSQEAEGAEGSEVGREAVAAFPSPPLMVGCADVLRGWPDAATALIGLLLIDEAHQRRGLGTAAYRLVEERIHDWPEIERVRAAVVRTVDVLPFWQRQGFSWTGEVRPYRYDHLVSESVVLEKSL